MNSSNSALAKWLAIGAVVVVILFAIWKVKTPPQVGGEVIADLPAAKQAERRQDAQKVTDQIKTIDEQAKRGERAPFTLVITQANLNTLMQDGAAGGNSQVRDMRAEISTGRLTFQGNVPYNGMNVVATLSGEPVVEGGKLRYRADSLLLGGVGAPDNIKTNSEQTVTTQLNRLVNARATISRVTVEAGQITVEGVTS